MKRKNKYFIERINSTYISKNRFIVVILLGLFYAFTFYSFMYITREGFRLLSSDEKYNLWVLNDKEVNFYNLFFAFISVITSLSICFRFWFERPGRIFGRYQYKTKALVFNQSCLNWYFIHWFSKVSLTFACFYGISGFFYTFSFYPEYNYLFILIVIVLFFNVWIPYLQLLKRKANKWIFISIPIVIVISFALSKINLINYNRMNNLVLQKNIYYKFKLQLPESENYHILERISLIENIFIVNDTNQQTQIIIDNQIVNISELGIYINKWKQMRDEWDRYNIRYQFHIDKNVKMQFVDMIKKELSFQGVRNINYAVKPIDAQHNQMFYFYYSFAMKLPFNIFPDDLHKNSGNFENIINLKLSDNNKCFIKDTIIEYSKLKNTIKNSVLHNPDYIIRFSISDNASFESYIRIVSGIKQAIDELRNDYALKNFSKKFENLREEQQDQILKKYKFSLIELTDSINN